MPQSMFCRIPVPERCWRRFVHRINAVRPLCFDVLPPSPASSPKLARTMQLSKAAEIPEELFEHIVWHIRGDNRGNDKERKRHLSVFGLVCRYWTRLCRPGLFSHITLRAPTDVKRFHEILDTPPPSPSIDPVADALITLFAEPDHSVEPWLHLVFSLLVPKLHKLAFLSVKPLHPGGKPYRTLHPSLPRSVPGSCMQIDDLCLDGLHFSSTRVLSRLLLSLPSLVSLNVYNLTIDTNLPTLKDLFAAPLCTQINSVKSDNLQLCLSPIPLLVGNSINSSNPAEQTQSRRRTRGILNGDDLEALWELLSIFDAASSFEIGRTHKGESQGAPTWTDTLYPVLSLFSRPQLPLFLQCCRMGPAVRPRDYDFVSDHTPQSQWESQGGAARAGLGGAPGDVPGSCSYR